MIILQILLFISIAAATPPSYKGHELTSFDKETYYYIEPKDDGFFLVIAVDFGLHTEGPIISEESGNTWGCSQRFNEVAQKLAQDRKREIAPILEKDKIIRSKIKKAGPLLGVVGGKQVTSYCTVEGNVTYAK